MVATWTCGQCRGSTVAQQGETKDKVRGEYWHYESGSAQSQRAVEGDAREVDATAG